MKVVAGLLAVALMAFPGSAGAEDPGSEQSEATTGTTERADARRSDDAPPMVDIANAKELTTNEKQSRAETMLGEMRDTLRRVTEILGEARASKDIVQLNCVNEKLTQVKGLLRISEDASVKMYDAISSGTEDVINHEYTKMSVAHQKVVLLRAQAEQCVGAISVYTGDTDVKVEIDPSISDRDPTDAIPPPPGPDVPPVASGF